MHALIAGWGKFLFMFDSFLETGTFNCLLLQADAGKAYKADADLPCKVAEALLQ